MVWTTRRWREMDSNHRYPEDKLPPRHGTFVASVTGPAPKGMHFFRDAGLRVRIQFPLSYYKDLCALHGAKTGVS